MSYARWLAARGARRRRHRPLRHADQRGRGAALSASARRGRCSRCTRRPRSARCSARCWSPGSLLGGTTSPRASRAAGWAHVAIAAWAACVPPPAAGAARGGRRASGGRSARSRWPLLPLAAVAFAYVGVESSVTMFAVPYASGALALDGDARSARDQRVLARPAGRARSRCSRCASALDARVAARRGRARGGAARRTACGLRHPLEVALFAIGARARLRLPADDRARRASARPCARGTAAGLAAGAGALGGVAVPWLTGAVGDAAGVALGFASLAGWCLVIALSAALARGVVA